MDARSGQVDCDPEQHSIEQSVTHRNASTVQVIHSRITAPDEIPTHPKDLATQEHKPQPFRCTFNNLLPSHEQYMQQNDFCVSQYKQQANANNFPYFGGELYGSGRTNEDATMPSVPALQQNQTHLQHQQLQQSQQNSTHMQQTQFQLKSQLRQQMQHEHLQYLHHNQNYQSENYGHSIAISNPVRDATTQPNFYDDYLMEGNPQKLPSSPAIGNDLDEITPTFPMNILEETYPGNSMHDITRSDNNGPGEAVSQPTGGFLFPATSTIIGGLNFKITFPANSSKFKSKPAEPLDGGSTEIFVTDQYLVQFQIHHLKCCERALRVRLAVYHRDAQRLSEPVRPCKKHLMDDHPEHIMEVPVQLDPTYGEQNSHSYVEVQPNMNIPVTDELESNYQGSVQMKFLCKNSCHKNAKWNLVCELLDSAQVCGRQNFYVKVCALPTRDSKEKIDPGTKKKRRSGKISTVKEEFELTKPTPSSNDESDAFDNSQTVIQSLEAIPELLSRQLDRQGNADSEQKTALGNSVEKRQAGHSAKITWQNEPSQYELSDSQDSQRLLAALSAESYEITGVADQTVTKSSVSFVPPRIPAKRPRTVSEAQDREDIQGVADEASGTLAGWAASQGHPLQPDACQALPVAPAYPFGPSSCGEAARAPHPGLHEAYRLLYDHDMKFILKLKFIESRLRMTHPQILHELEAKFEELINDVPQLQ